MNRTTLTVIAWIAAFWGVFGGWALLGEWIHPRLDTITKDQVTTICALVYLIASKTHHLARKITPP